MPLNGAGYISCGCDIAFRITVVITRDNNIRRMTKEDRVWHRTVCKSRPKDGLAVTIVPLNNKIEFAVTVVIARRGEVCREAPWNESNNVRCQASAVEPIALTTAPSINSRVSLSVAVIISDNRRLVAAPTKHIDADGISRALKYIERGL